MAYIVHGVAKNQRRLINQAQHTRSSAVGKMVESTDLGAR